MVPYLPFQETALLPVWLRQFLRSLLIFLGAGPAVGLIGGVFVQHLVEFGVSGLSGRDLFGLIYFLPAAYTIGMIPALGTGIVCGVLSLLAPRIMRFVLLRAILGGVIGTIVTYVFCQSSGLVVALALWAGLPAGAVCAVLIPCRFSRRSKVTGA